MSAGWVQRYLFGLHDLALAATGRLPSQRLRRLLLRRVFRMRIAPGSVLYGGFEIRSPRRISIGPGTSIGTRAGLDGRGGLEIGERVNPSNDVMLWTAQHDHQDPGFVTRLAPVRLERYVWLGPRVVVLPGVTVAEGCVVGANAVVTKSTEPYGLYAGLPAKRIGERPRGLDYIPGGAYTPFI